MDMTTTTISFNGVECRIERTGSAPIPYRLVGPRGGVYLLVREVPRPEQMFVVRSNGKGRIVAGRFSDKGGVLREMA